MFHDWTPRRDVVAEGVCGMSDSLGDRMKCYERAFEVMLPRRMPVVIRIDGRAFHTLTKRMFGRGWNREFVGLMVDVAKEIQRQAQGCNIAYCQSDEVSFLLTDYRTITSESWFGNDLSKLVSLTASIAGSVMSLSTKQNVTFDSRAFVLPQDDVVNYFIWRQQDATRNAIQMAARELYSHKELHLKNCSDLQEMMFQKGTNFNDLPTIRKRGFCVVNGELDEDIPIFTQDRSYIEKFVYVRED